MFTFICRRCSASWGSVMECDDTLCSTCREDIAWAAMPLCSRCEQHRVGPKTHAAGGTLCRGCAYAAAVDASQLEYEPVLSIVREITGLTTYVEQTGGMVMVAKVYLPVGTIAFCEWCEQPISLDVDAPLWRHDGPPLDGAGESIADTLGLVGLLTCRDWQGDIHSAKPQEGYPQIFAVNDADETWVIGYAESYGGDTYCINTDDLWVEGDAVYDEPTEPVHRAATPEDVAARIVLLIDNPELAEAY